MMLPSQLCKTDEACVGEKLLTLVDIDCDSDYISSSHTRTVGESDSLKPASQPEEGVSVATHRTNRPRSKQELQASFHILSRMPSCVRPVKHFKMATEAQMRSSPACFSGCQSTVSPSRVINRPQRLHLTRGAVALRSSSKTSLSLLSPQGARTRQAPCTAASRDTHLESTEMPSNQQISGDGPRPTHRRASLQTAAVGGIVALLLAMAVPAPADAAEAFPLEFLSRFLVSRHTLLPCK